MHRLPVLLFFRGVHATSRATAALGVLVVVGVLLAGSLSLWRLYEAAWRSAQQHADNRAAAVAAHASQVFAAAHYILDSVTHEVTSTGFETAEDLRSRIAGRAMHDLLRARAESFAVLDVIAVFDANGRLVTFSREHPAPPIEIKDREAFRVAQAGHDESFVTSAVRNRASGTWTFYLARRLSTASGGFGGVVMVGLSSDYFARFYDEVREQASDARTGRNVSQVTITLLRRDLAVLARAPGNDALFGHRLPDEGHYRHLESGTDSLPGPPSLPFASPWDAQASAPSSSLVSHRWADKGRVLVSVVVPQQTFLGDWNDQAVVVGLLACIVAACMTALFRSLSQSLQRREHLMTETLRLRREAESASRTKSEFLATMSHEIRTPLHGVLGTADLLQKTSLTQDQQQLTRTLQTSGRNLLGIINDILDLSRIEADELEVASGVFSPAEVVRGVKNLLTGYAAKRGLNLRLELAEGLPRAVIGDVTLVRQVLVNLASNAVKFTERGEVRLAASAVSSTPAAGVLVRFEVEDSGHGISPESRERIFQPFVQADGSMTRRFGGTGLGLAISRRLVNLMGGVIDFRSELGRGSTFWFDLPLKLADDEDLAGADQISEEEMERFANSGAAPLLDGPEEKYAGRHVLLVEDDAVNAMIAEAQLQRLGCSCDIAMDGPEAIQRLRTGHYDLVLMDCMLPGMSGYDVTEAWREEERSTKRPRLPILALTANAIASNAEQCARAGMDGYLTKPCSVDKLDTALKRWLGEAPSMP